MYLDNNARSESFTQAGIEKSANNADFKFVTVSIFFTFFIAPYISKVSFIAYIE